MQGTLQRRAPMLQMGSPGNRAGRPADPTYSPSRIALPTYLHGRQRPATENGLTPITEDKPSKSPARKQDAHIGRPTNASTNLGHNIVTIDTSLILTTKRKSWLALTPFGVHTKILSPADTDERFWTCPHRSKVRNASFRRIPVLRS